MTGDLGRPSGVVLLTNVLDEPIEPGSGEYLGIDVDSLGVFLFVAFSGFLLVLSGVVCTMVLLLSDGGGGSGGGGGGVRRRVLDKCTGGILGTGCSSILASSISVLDTISFDKLGFLL
jgi:hypothetical protein